MKIHLLSEFENNAEKFDFVSKTMQDQKLNDLNLATSFESKVKFWQSNLVIAKLNNDLNKLKIFSKKSIEIWDDYPLQKTLQPYNYCIALSNYLVHSQVSGSSIDEEDYLKVLNLMKSIEINSLPLRVLKNSIYFYDRLMFMPITQNFKDLDKVVNEIETFFDEYSNLVNIKEKRELIYLICGLYIVVGKAEYALEWSIKFENLPKSNLQKIMAFSVSLFSLLAYFQNEDVELLLSRVRSLQRKLAKEEQFFAIQKLILNMLSKADQLIYTYEAKQLWHSYSEQIIELLKDPEEQYAIGNFDILTWIEAQKNKTTMERIYNEK
jgi:hypothetical protein